MKENQATISHDSKPQGMASVSPPPAKGSAGENAQPKGEEKRKPKLRRLSQAAGQRK
jgi:hypothetical protein